MVAFNEITLKTKKPIVLMSLREFERELLKRRMAYPYKNGVKMPFEHLPFHISELTKDFYRGLSWLVRKSGAYKKTSIPFAEFYWGSYLKRKLNLKDEVFNRKTLQKSIRHSLLENSETVNLPGFNGYDLSDKEVIVKTKKALKKLIKNDLIK